MPVRAERWGVALAVLVGAVWRFGTLDIQSLGRDEAVTKSLVDDSLAGMLDRLPASESTPPLFYLLEWLWTRAAGLGEIGLRSFPALCGALSILAAWALARRLGGARAGVAAAWIVAVNPFAVWYAQEARAYSLLGLFALLTCTAWLDALGGRRRAAWWWAAAAAGALLTHYFALLLVVPQGLVLAWRALRNSRRRLQALAPALTVALVALALAPLALAQRGTGNTAWIKEEPLLERLAATPKHVATGLFGTPFDLLAVATFALLLAGVVLAVVIRPPLPGARTLAGLLGGALAFAAVALPDYVLDRNLLELALPVLALTAAGLAAVRRYGVPLVVALVAGMAACSVAIAVDEELQREDWRTAARQIDTELVVASIAGETALRAYRPDLARATGAVLTTGITYVADWRFGRERPPTPPPPGPGWTLVRRTDGPTTTTVVYRAPEGAGEGLFGPDALVETRLRTGDPGVVLVSSP